MFKYKLIFGLVLLGAIIFTYYLPILRISHNHLSHFNFFWKLSTPDGVDYTTSVSSQNLIMNSSYNEQYLVEPVVLVFIHIQKTSGTVVERRIAEGGFTNHVCRKHGNRLCAYKDTTGNTWMVSRFTSGWNCQVHADLTTFLECLDEKLNILDHHKVRRKYKYFTILRNPVDRYLSEWLNVQRGSTWQGASLLCNGKSPSYGQYHPCYSDIRYNNFTGSTNMFNWVNVSLKKFMDCPYNLASNRQTRMLANLSKLGCYNHLFEWTRPIEFVSSLTLSSSSLLLSAKRNILSFLSCFGLSEYLIYSQYLYQICLNVTFKRILFDFVNLTFQTPFETHATFARSALNLSSLKMVENHNFLDINLYRFALRFFLYRLVNRLVFDSSIPIIVYRPLRTLWFRYPKPESALKSLLLFSPQDSIPYSGRFFKLLNLSLIKRFLAGGSRFASSDTLHQEIHEWQSKLFKEIKFQDFS